MHVPTKACPIYHDTLILHRVCRDAPAMQTYCGLVFPDALCQTAQGISAARAA